MSPSRSRWRDLDLGIVDGAGGGFPAERVDVAGLIGDVLDVDVDEAQADFPQFHFDAVGNVGDQLVAVGVDFLDGHRGDDHAHLAEDDVLREFLDLHELRPSSRSAAFSITPGSVLMPTVKVEGVLTRMFCCESAPRSWMSIGIGVRLRKAKSWMTGHTNAAPP